jgi:hypothetical protein
MTEGTRPARDAAVPDQLAARLRRPIHFGALLGLSTGLYATTLAGTAVLQQQADDELAAARAPAVALAAELQSANGRLATALEGLSRREAEIARAYSTVSDRVGATEAALGELAAVVGDVRGAASALPRRIALPAIPSAGSVRVSKAPAHATTGGSAVK